MNALDLVKVGRAFGFAVPPRVNVTVGGGKAGKIGQKRPRDETTEDNDENENEWEDEEDEEEQPRNDRRQGKARRMETLGKKTVQKEMYKNSRERKTGNWSR